MRILSEKFLVPIETLNILYDFAEFENIASHGYEISQEIAKWALIVIP